MDSGRGGAGGARSDRGVQTLSLPAPHTVSAAVKRLLGSGFQCWQPGGRSAGGESVWREQWKAFPVG